MMKNTFRMPRVVVLMLLAGATIVQTQGVAFEVASIRPAKPGTRPSLFTAENGTLRVAGYSLKSLVQMGWSVREFQVVGGPAWVSSDGFDIAAKGDSSATDAQLRLMIQALLADRFQLRLRPDIRELPIYALVVGKEGHKLRPPTDALPPSLNSGPGHIVAQKISILNLARLLAPGLDRPVIDRTNLTGRFDFTLEWALEPSPEAPVANTSAPSMFTAVQEQLGLKLEAQRGPVEVLVIDSAERPSEN
jgi:uncharacterized protein (TIGR03435 family)